MKHHRSFRTASPQVSLPSKVHLKVIDPAQRAHINPRRHASAQTLIDSTVTTAALSRRKLLIYLSHLHPFNCISSSSSSVRHNCWLRLRRRLINIRRQPTIVNKIFQYVKWASIMIIIIMVVIFISATRSIMFQYLKAGQSPISGMFWNNGAGVSSSSAPNFPTWHSLLTSVAIFAIITSLTATVQQ